MIELRKYLNLSDESLSLAFLFRPRNWLYIISVCTWRAIFQVDDFAGDLFLIDQVASKVDFATNTATKLSGIDRESPTEGL
jgi:hypothetical protein